MAPVTVDVKTAPHQIVQKMYLAYVFVRLGFKPRTETPRSLGGEFGDRKLMYV